MDATTEISMLVAAAVLAVVSGLMSMYFDPKRRPVAKKIIWGLIMAALLLAGAVLFLRRRRDSAPIDDEDGEALVEDYTSAFDSLVYVAEEKIAVADAELRIAKQKSEAARNAAQIELGKIRGIEDSRSRREALAALLAEK